MAGPELAMRAESAYDALLTAARSYKLAGDKLTLYDASGNESLIFRRATL
jgi:heat shock protein HslJ